MWGHMNAARLPASYPQYFARARGCRLWDVDGNEYIDLMCSYGPMILGYGDEDVERAAARQREQADIANGPSPRLVELAAGSDAPRDCTGRPPGRCDRRREHRGVHGRRLVGNADELVAPRAGAWIETWPMRPTGSRSPVLREGFRACPPSARCTAAREKRPNSWAFWSRSADGESVRIGRLGGGRGTVVEPSPPRFQWVTKYTGGGGCCLENLRAGNHGLLRLHSPSSSSAIQRT